MKNSLTIKSKDNTQAINLDDDNTQNLAFVVPRGIDTLELVQEFEVPSHLELRNLPLIDNKGSYSSELDTDSYSSSLHYDDHSVRINLDSSKSSSRFPVLTLICAISIEQIARQSFIVNHLVDDHLRAIELPRILSLFENIIEQVETVYNVSPSKRGSEMERTAQGLLALSKAMDLPADFIADMFNQGVGKSCVTERLNISCKVESVTSLASKCSLRDLLKQLTPLKKELIVSLMNSQSSQSTSTSAFKKLPRKTCLIAI